MKLKNREIMALYAALTELRGAPTVVINSRGQKEALYEPYDMGPKFKWNAAKDRNILRRIAEAHEEQVMEFQLELRKIRRELAAAKDDPQENQRKLQAETDRVNDELRRLANTEEEVDGLLMLPASGLSIKTSKIPPTLIDELMVLIDGEPDFDKEEKPK